MYLSIYLSIYLREVPLLSLLNLTCKGGTKLFIYVIIEHIYSYA